MSERFVIGHMDPHASTIFLTKADPSTIEDEEEPLEIGSWLTLYEGDGPPRTAIKCFEPEPKPAKELRASDVVLDLGTPYRVLEGPDLPDADGKIWLNVRDIFADEVVDLPFAAEEDITMVAASTTRYYVRNVPPAEFVPGTLVLLKQEGVIEDNEERVFEIPGGRIGPSLLPFFNTAILLRMPVTLLIYEVMAEDALNGAEIFQHIYTPTAKYPCTIPLGIDEQDMDLRKLTLEDAGQDVKGKKKEDANEATKATKTEESEEVDYEEDESESEEEEDTSQTPLELGGFLTPVNNTTNPPTTPPPAKELPARDLSPGQAFLLPTGGNNDRPVEIVKRSDTRAQQGPLASRHQISFELCDLWDREMLRPVVVRATEKLRVVECRRVRWEVIGRDDPILTLRKNHRDKAEQIICEFIIPGGKLGDGLALFFADCEDDETGEIIPATLLMMEALGRWQVTAFGVGEWSSLD